MAASSSLVQVLVLAAVLVPLFQQPADDARVRIDVKPMHVEAPMSTGWGGTEVVTIDVTNQGTSTIELPERRWLVVARMDAPASPLFTPTAPYVPLLLRPTEKVTVTWRLREPTNVQLARSGASAVPARATAGAHHMTVYFRAEGGDAWRSQEQMVEIEENAISAALSGPLLVGGVILVMLVVGIATFARAKS